MKDWKPKTRLGRLVAEGAVTSLDDILDSGIPILEPEIVDRLLPSLKSEIVLIGGSPGKGGGIRRTPTRRTARMHRSGRRYTSSAMVVAGNQDGYFGIGTASAHEHRVALEKALSDAKRNMIRVLRGCGSWDCNCNGMHSIPVRATGKAGSVRVVLLPAPKGIGLACHDEGKKIMRLAGIRDIWSKTYGESRSHLNYVRAVYDAFKTINRMKRGAHEAVASTDDVSEAKKPKRKRIKTAADSEVA